MRTTTLENTLRTLDPAPPATDAPHGPMRISTGSSPPRATAATAPITGLSATDLPSAPARSSAVLDVLDGAPGSSPSPRRR